MKKTNKQNLALILALAAGVGLDQLVKALTVLFIAPGQSVTVLGGLIRFTYVMNTGAAFSFLSDHPAFFVIFSSLINALLGYFLFRGFINNKVAFWSLSAVLCGGLGNLVDRFVRGAVVDMIDFRFFKIPKISFDPFSIRLADFAVFNVADCFVTCGVLVFIVIFIMKKGEVVEWNLLSKEQKTDSDLTNSSSDTQN